MIVPHAGLALLTLVLWAGCDRQDASVTGEKSPAHGTLPVVERGTFERRWLLSGEVDAVSLADLMVPRVPSGKVTIRWLAPHGAVVKKGDRVVELDSAAFTVQLQDKTSLVQGAEIEVRRQGWQNELADVDRVLELDRKKTLLSRAEIDADLPPGLLPKRDFLEKQLAVKRARTEVDRAEMALAVQRKTAALDLNLKKLALERAMRELERVRTQVRELSLLAPADGTVMLGDHPEGRKFQVGDEAFVGAVLARLPDLRQLQVKGALIDVDDGRVEPGMTAEVILDAHPDRMVRGKVSTLSTMARELSDISLRRAFTATVVLDSADPAVLRPGMSARIEVILERREDVPLVPRWAAVEALGGARLRLASGRESDAKVGPCNATTCVVEGLEAGTRLWGAP